MGLAGKGKECKCIDSQSEWTGVFCRWTECRTSGGEELEN